MYVLLELWLSMFPRRPLKGVFLPYTGVSDRTNGKMSAGRGRRTQTLSHSLLQNGGRVTLAMSTSTHAADITCLNLVPGMYLYILLFLVAHVSYPQRHVQHGAIRDALHML